MGSMTNLKYSPAAHSGTVRKAGNKSARYCHARMEQRQEPAVGGQVNN